MEVLDQLHCKTFIEYFAPSHVMTFRKQSCETNRLRSREIICLAESACPFVHPFLSALTADKCTANGAPDQYNHGRVDRHDTT